MSTKQSRALSSVLSPQTLPDFMSGGPCSLTDVPMSPDLANAILTFNSRNRALRPLRVETFIRILREGRWINTGEPVILTTGALNEGQHRLEAIRTVGVTVPVDLRFGISEDAFEVTGSGATRSPGDALSILGVSSHVAVAAILKMLLGYESGMRSGWALRQRIGGDEIVAAWRRWPDVKEAHRMMVNNLSNPGRLLYSSAAGAFTFLALRQRNPVRVNDFLFAVGTGVVGHVQDPARLLRERLQTDRKLVVHTREAAVTKLALYIEAWTAWDAGERPKALTWKKGMPFPPMAGVEL